ncbi:MAG: hypothetical protein NC122_04450 [Faecalibacterium sp.]|nr:hypothetical protein [Ruminococcus sp.]MCM1391788.1 hypothetical protein [Ruminococcus sp.]MCM1485434.1 hypothetical protein [Faecalibacterium sp.]
MKKILSLIISAVLICSLFGCSSNQNYDIEIDGMGISEGVYAYYLDKVMSSPNSYSVNKDDTEQLKAKALELCKQCVATDKFMSENKISLDLYLKSETAQTTESMWSLFGEYYKSIGVAKSDITTINTYENQKEKLVQYYYGSNGKKPVSQDDLKQKFVELYIGFKGFEVPLTKINAKGETVDMTDSEKKDVETQLRKIADKINDGQSIDEANKQYQSKQGLVVTEDLDVILTKKNDPMYDDDFFDKLSTISHDRAAIVKSGKSIYVVQRVKIASSDDDAFSQYSTEVLKTMKMSDVEKQIIKWAEKLEVNVNEKETAKIYNTISSVKSN